MHVDRFHMDPLSVPWQKYQFYAFYIIDRVFKMRFDF